MEIKDNWKADALIDKKTYNKMYEDSILDNDSFWNKHGQRIVWKNKYTNIKDVKYSNNDVNIKWYYDGSLNVTESCIDRHAKQNPNKIAIIWEGDDPSDTKKYHIVSYSMK